MNCVVHVGQGESFGGDVSGDNSTKRPAISHRAEVSHRMKRASLEGTFFDNLQMNVLVSVVLIYVLCTRT